MANHQGLITCKLTAISPSCIRLCATWWNATGESNLKRGIHTCRKCGLYFVSLIAGKYVKAVTWSTRIMYLSKSISTSYYLHVTLFSVPTVLRSGLLSHFCLVFVLHTHTRSLFLRLALARICTESLESFLTEAADLPQDRACFVSGPGLVTTFIFPLSRAEVAAWPLEFNTARQNHWITLDNKHKMCHFFALWCNL